MVLGDEVRADLLGDMQAAVMVLLGDADPLHRRMARCDLAAKQSDPAGADDGEPDAFCLPPHRLPPTISATAESAAFDSGSSTGSLRSAGRSAAVYVSTTIPAPSGATLPPRSRMQAPRKRRASGPPRPPDPWHP